ncbi:hypothetical protein BDD12DRAFT_887355 [Trichophaea hybrida]|nr:hypothetical protein BDD12DRAFT_887355 [Trichophaea hybrida]
MYIAIKHGKPALLLSSIDRIFVYNSLASVSVIAFCDYINRRIVSLVRQWRLDVADSTGNYHGPKGGDFNIYKPRQQILERSSCVITSLPDNDPFIEIRFTVTLPAHGRSINGRKAQELLVTHLPNIMERGLLWEHQDEERVWTHLRTMEVQESLRNNLAKLGLVAFVGNKSILPRASGADPRPMKESVVVFQSPSNLEVTIATGIQDHTGQPISVTGMGIPRGITVIAGGGFHGKSTLLEALQFGIYNVVPGDGRELVVTEPNVFKVRAEDGRNVVCTDISPFISKLPGGKSTTSFTTMDASGSTSMSANIQEALEIGATALIIDEDTSATNFLVRDSKMHELVRTEPITPLVSKVDALYRERDVSTIIVVGGCGDYLNPASTVLGMESYSPQDWTTRAHEIAAKYPNAAPSSPIYGPIPNRVITLPGLGDKPPTARGIDKVLFKLDRTKVNTEDANAEVDITALEQFVEEGQTNLCVDALRVISGGSLKSVRSWVDELEKLMDQKGMNIRGDQKPFGNIARARPLEILAVVNRVRGLRVGDSFQAAQVSG